MHVIGKLLLLLLCINVRKDSLSYVEFKNLVATSPLSGL